MSTSFQVLIFIGFCWISDAMSESIWHVLPEKTVPKIASKRELLASKQPFLVVSRGSQKAETTVRVQKAVGIWFYCIFQHCKDSNKLFGENEKDQCQERITVDLARPWPSAGEFWGQTSGNNDWTKASEI